MKYIKQMMIILLISFCGEMLKYFLPFPIPASIYGFLLLFLGLLSGIIKLDMVKDAAKYLIEIMPLMFIPAGVGLITSWGVLKPVLLPFAVITVVTTIAVMAAAGRVTQFVIRRQKGEHHE